MVSILGRRLCVKGIWAQGIWAQDVAGQDVGFVWGAFSAGIRAISGVDVRGGGERGFSTIERGAAPH